MMDLQEIISKTLSGKMPIKFNGHCLVDIRRRGREKEDFEEFFLRHVRDGIVTELRFNHSSRRTTEEVDAFQKPFFANIGWECLECASKLKFYTDWQSWWLSDQCPYPTGHPPYSLDQSFPSGQIAIGTDFRQAFPLNEARPVSINSMVGKKLYSEAYARSGIAMGFMGNASPTMWRIGRGKNKFILGGPSRTNDVGSISGSLWWYSFADFEELKRQCEVHKVKLSDIDYSLVNCEPGTYRVTHKFNDGLDEYRSNPVYAEIEKI
jgi:hypothetical protein